LKQLDILRKERPTSCFLPTLKTFNEVNAKVYTINTHWASMILSHNGVSAEKACAIVERWPTTQHFISDLSKQSRLAGNSNGQSSQKKSKNSAGASYILEEVAKGSKRDLGPALAQQLYDIWTQEEY